MLAPLPRIDFSRHRLALTNDAHAKLGNPGRLRVHSPNLPSRGARCLLVLAEEEVVGRVGHELSLTHSAGGGRNSSAAGVQTLDEGGFGQEVAAVWPFLVPD